jgi:hypothetical protein
MLYRHKGILFSLKKQRQLAIWYDMDGTGEHHAKWNKLDTKRHILHVLMYVWI